MDFCISMPCIGCFRIELIINCNIANEFQENEGADKNAREAFGLSKRTTGTIASIFGLVKMSARTVSGFVSDLFNKISGFRRRLRWFYIEQCIEGLDILHLRVLFLYSSCYYWRWLRLLRSVMCRSLNPRILVPVPCIVLAAD